jgi:hypothetical protein
MTEKEKDRKFNRVAKKTKSVSFSCARDSPLSEKADALHYIISPLSEKVDALDYIISS